MPSPAYAFVHKQSRLPGERQRTSQIINVDSLQSDLRKPLTGSTAASLCVQLSWIQSLRSFDPEEPRKLLPAELLEELEWEAQMHEDTRVRYNSHFE
jgi:hypothetical protein